MKLGIKTAIAAGAMAGVASLGATAASALPSRDGKLAIQREASMPTVEKVRYRCGYYGCYHRRVYGYYRPRYRYRYGYYRPYYYRPHFGIGIGGIGIGLY